MSSREPARPPARRDRGAPAPARRTPDRPRAPRAASEAGTQHGRASGDGATPALARLVALGSKAPRGAVLGEAAQLVRLIEPAIAGVWVLADPAPMKVVLPGRGPATARAVARALVDVLGVRRRPKGVFSLPLDVTIRLQALVIAGGRPRQVLGGLILEPRASGPGIRVASDALGGWWARAAAESEASVQARGLELVRALGEGLLEGGESPLGLDRLLVSLRGIAPCDALSLALPVGSEFRVVHALPDAAPARLLEDMGRELEPALEGRRSVVEVERLRVARGGRGGVHSSVILGVPDPAGGRGGLLALHATKRRAFGALQVRVVSLIVPGLARALAAARTEHTRRRAEHESREELERARDVQHGLGRLPQTGDQRRGVETFDVAVSSTASAGVSGDLHEVVRRDDGSLAMLIADVCGHGVAAALQAAFLHGVLAAERAVERAPAERLALLNAAVHEALSTRATTEAPLVTASAASLSASELTVTHCQAGHPPPLIVRRGRAFESQALEEHGGPANVVLGVTRPWRGQSAVAALAPGDLFVLYTDGVIEASAPGGERFGKPRLIALLEGLGPVSAHDAVRAVESALADFTAAAPAHDDRTLVAVRVTG